MNGGSIMFYCDSCATKRAWPGSIARSYGRCEVCGETRACNDRASSTLPLPPQPPKETQEDILKRLQERLDRM